VPAWHSKRRGVPKIKSRVLNIACKIRTGEKLFSKKASLE
jgi:hypothetical protein